MATRVAKRAAAGTKRSAGKTTADITVRLEPSHTATKKRLSINMTVSVVAYLKPRSATLVVYITRNPGVLAVRTHRDVAKRILSGSRVRKRWRVGRTEGVSVRAPFELVAPLLVGNKKLVAPGAVDPLFREAYRRSEEVRETLYKRALERTFHNRRAAEAYIRA